MTISEMRRELEKRGIQLTKSLGQNFLHDGNQLRRIVAQAELRPEDRVLEIGPGLGPLTTLLLREAGEVWAIEKDARLLAVLQERFAGEPRLRLQGADALSVVSQTGQDWRGWKLVSNLPYSVASPILVELAKAASPPERLVATLQLEVAERLMARAGDEHYGLLGLLVQLRYEPKGWFKIPASCFFPAPDVDSACVRLDWRTVPLLAAEQHNAFTRLVKLAFSQRRKMMLKLLKTHWATEELERAFQGVGIPVQTRAEAVSLEQFVRLTEVLTAPSAR